jgi:hypothetical protein
VDTPARPPSRAPTTGPGKTRGHPWGLPMATRGERQWPSTGSLTWPSSRKRPLSDPARGPRSEPRLSRPFPGHPPASSGLADRLRVRSAAHRDLCRDRPVYRGKLQGSELDLCRTDQRTRQARPHQRACAPGEGHLPLPFAPRLPGHPHLAHLSVTQACFGRDGFTEALRLISCVAASSTGTMGHRGSGCSRASRTPASRRSKACSLLSSTRT